MKKGLTWLIYFLLLTASFTGAQTPSNDEKALETNEVTVDVLFTVWNNNLSQEYEEALKPHAEMLIENPDIKAVIEGYSDSSGDPDSNVQLSGIRAEAVKFYLIGLGVLPENLTTVPKGGTDIFAEGDSPEALSENRRARLIYNLPVIEEQETTASNEDSLTLEESLGEDIEITLFEGPSPTPGPTAPPPPTPGPTPRPTPPPSLLNSLDNEVNNTAPGKMVFKSPREMQLQSTYLVEATVNNELAGELSASVSESSGIEGLILSEDMLVLLTGSGFDIQPVEESYNSKDLFPDDHGAQRESLTPEGDVKWRWYVTPVKAGFQPLNLSLIIDIEEPEFSQINTEYEIYKKIIDVREGFLRSLLSSYWLSGFLILIIIAVLSFLVLDRYNAL